MCQSRLHNAYGWSDLKGRRQEAMSKSLRYDLKSTTLTHAMLRLEKVLVRAMTIMYCETE